MDGATIRAASPVDAALVREVVEAAYRTFIPRLGKKPGPMLDDYETRTTQQQVWVLEWAGAITGILVLEEKADGLLLDNIAAAPGQQGKGFGRALLRFAEEEAVRRGWRDIRLYTNALMTENIALYQRIGYVETARAVEQGFDRVYMTKRLAGD